MQRTPGRVCPSKLTNFRGQVNRILLVNRHRGRPRPEHLALQQFYKLIELLGQVVGVSVCAVGVKLQERGDRAHGKQRKATHKTYPKAQATDYQLLTWRSSTVLVLPGTRGLRCAKRAPTQPDHSRNPSLYTTVYNGLFVFHCLAFLAKKSCCPSTGFVLFTG